MSKEIREFLIWTTERVSMKMGQWSLRERGGEEKNEQKFLGLTQWPLGSSLCISSVDAGEGISSLALSGLAWVNLSANA
jgi:hypothetical protein